MTCTNVTAHLDLALTDVPAAAGFFERVLGLPVRHTEPHRAEVQLRADLAARLRPAAPRPVGTVRRGPGPRIDVLVADVRAAVAEVRRRGATVLIEPVLTEWGTESAFVAGPDDLVIELYRPALV